MQYSGLAVWFYNLDILAYALIYIIFNIESEVKNKWRYHLAQADFL